MEGTDVEMDFKTVQKDYRPLPFWSWNEKLNTEETREQVKMMAKAGMGGFFMHARGGLQTEYMGDEWFENVSVATDEAEKSNMSAWAYDENGWPSGFGNGIVNGKGVKYQQKYLRMTKHEHKENFIARSGNYYFYYDVNPFYVDTLDGEAVREFINAAYKPYYEKYKNQIEGFFTDEPQISRNGIPWSFVFEKEYDKRYNEKLYDHLEELFLAVGDYKNTRVRFWKMVTELFSENYFKQIYDWCNKRNMKFTGHLASEETMLSQLISNGACMPHYEYFNMPGMDWLGRNMYDCLTARQVSSVAEQLGKKQVLSETFALCGHNVSFDELKGIYEWQMSRGINRLCQHLEGYSLRGIRKRDYPPAMYYQQPWWEEYDKFIDAVSRVGMILSGGEKKADVLLIHPQTTAWTLYDDGENKGLKELDKKFVDKVKELEEKHIIFHLGDEIIMERHARVEKDKLIIGDQSYSYVLNPCGKILLQNTVKLLDEFKRNGGKTDVKPNDVTDNKDITYYSCRYPGFIVHYFVNTSKDTKYAHINVTGKKLNILSGEIAGFSNEYEFEPYDSLIVIDDGSDASEKKDDNLVYLPQRAKIISASDNVLTLDRCDYYFDGVIQEKNGYVLNICERANKQEKKLRIKQEHHVRAEYVPQKMYLAMETPQKFDIMINGSRIEKNITGYFADKSFEKIDISGLMKVGENIITLECDFEQSDRFYENLKKARIFESEKNKLVYDMEIESIYLLGDFSVKTDGEFFELKRNAVRYNGSFVISKPINEIEIKHIEKQGFAFFSGQMTLETQIDIKDRNSVLVLDRRGVNAIKLEINNMEKTILFGNRIRLGDFGASGNVRIRLTLINNLRNMLGPHHLNEGESHCVAPGSFFKEECIWNLSSKEEWDDNYCFVETSI